MQYTALIVKVDGWYAATVKELSGVHTQGKSLAEVRENLVDAIEMVIDSNVRHFKELSNEFIEETIHIN